jgi:predicted transposase YdaD
VISNRQGKRGVSNEDLVLNFEFGTVKLKDYQNRWTELETSENPFATVVMAHLKTQQTSQKPQERKTWKFSLIRRLYEQGLQEKDIRNLYRFIDWVMILPKSLEAEFWQEFKQFEQERTMAYITTGERIGYERGREEGKQEGEQTLILRLLQKRVGELPEKVRERIQNLSLNQLEELGEALLDFTKIEDLFNWLTTHQPD